MPPQRQKHTPEMRASLQAVRNNIDEIMNLQTAGIKQTEISKIFTARLGFPVMTCHITHEVGAVIMKKINAYRQKGQHRTQQPQFKTPIADAQKQESWEI